MDENSEIKATLVSPPADVHAPHSLKDERESFGHKLGEVLSSFASNAFRLEQTFQVYFDVVILI